MRAPSSSHATAFICLQVAVLTAALTLPAKANSFTVFASADSFGVGDSVKITIISDPRRVSCLGAKIVYTLAQGSPTFELSPPSSTTKRESKQLANGWSSIDLSSGIAELTLTGSVEPTPKTAGQSEAATTEAPGQSSSVRVALLLRPLGKSGPARDRNHALIPAQSLNLTFRPPIKPTQTPQPAGSVKVLDLTGKTVRLTRRTLFPWSLAHGRTVVWLSGSKRPLNVRDLEIVPPPLHSAHGESVAEGRVSILRDSQSSSSPKSGRAIPLHLKLESFRAYGDHEFTFAVNDKSLQETQIVTLKLAVTDQPYLPVLVLISGVMIAFVLPILKKRIPARSATTSALAALEKAELLLRLKASQRRDPPTVALSSGQPREQSDDRYGPSAISPTEKPRDRHKAPVFRSWLQRLKSSRLSFTGTRIAEGERLATKLEERILEAEENFPDSATEASATVDTHSELGAALEKARELVKQGYTGLANGGTLLRSTKPSAQQLKIALTALVVATLMGIHQLYLEQVFGSPKQYLGAFLWGSGLQAGLSALPSFIDKLMDSLRSAVGSPGS